MILWLALLLLGDPLAGPPERLTVLLFTRPDCPISNRYAPEVNRLYNKFAPAQVAFYLVYPDPSLTTAAIEKHRHEYSYPMPGLHDAQHTLARKSQARVTPEAAVFRGSQLIYHGRIDDRYVDFGQSRRTPQTHDLESVLTALTAGQPSPLTRTKAIGCAIEDLR